MVFWLNSQAPPMIDEAVGHFASRLSQVDVHESSGFALVHDVDDIAPRHVGERVNDDGDVCLAELTEVLDARQDFIHQLIVRADDGRPDTADRAAVAPSHEDADLFELHLGFSALARSAIIPSSCLNLKEHMKKMQRQKITSTIAVTLIATGLSDASPMFWVPAMKSSLSDRDRRL
jgi:hypothetical protein